MKPTPLGLPQGSCFLAPARRFPPAPSSLSARLVVPPPSQNYTPKPVYRPPPDKPKPAETPAPAAKGGHYEGRTWVPD